MTFLFLFLWPFILNKWPLRCLRLSKAVKWDKNRDFFHCDSLFSLSLFVLCDRIFMTQSLNCEKVEKSRLPAESGSFPLLVAPLASWMRLRQKLLLLFSALILKSSASTLLFSKLFIHQWKLSLEFRASKNSNEFIELKLRKPQLILKVFQTHSLFSGAYIHYFFE